MFNKTKIIATIGPSSNHPHIISKLIKKGMNVARINMAHQTSNEDIKNTINMIREESQKVNKHIGILMDIAGPKIRVDLSNINKEKINITKGHIYSLGFSKMNDIPMNMEVKFENSIGEKAFVKIDDGSINFKILSIKNNILKLKAITDGNISSNKGVNFPGLLLDIPSVTPKDKKDIRKAFNLAMDAHNGVRRKSGDPYRIMKPGTLAPARRRFAQRPAGQSVCGRFQNLRGS